MANDPRPPPISNYAEGKPKNRSHGVFHRLAVSKGIINSKARAADPRAHVRPTPSLPKLPWNKT